MWWDFIMILYDFSGFLWFSLIFLNLYCFLIVFHRFPLPALFCWGGSFFKAPKHAPRGAYYVWYMCILRTFPAERLPNTRRTARILCGICAFCGHFWTNGSQTRAARRVLCVIYLHFAGISGRTAPKHAPRGAYSVWHLCILRAFLDRTAPKHAPRGAY